MATKEDSKRGGRKRTGLHHDDYTCGRDALMRLLPAVQVDFYKPGEVKIHVLSDFLL